MVVRGPKTRTNTTSKVTENEKEYMKKTKGSGDDLKEKLLNVHEMVPNKIRVASDRIKTRYDLKGNSEGFQAGGLVWPSV